MSPVAWLRPADAAATPPVLAPLEPAARARVEALAANEAARFLRRLHARVLTPPGGAAPPGLAVAIAPGPPAASVGLTIRAGGRDVAAPRRPYLRLEASADGLGRALLHEGAHAIHDALAGGVAPAPDWQPWPSGLFAVTSRGTAFREGYALHLEALWARFGAAPRVPAAAFRAIRDGEAAFEGEGDLAARQRAPARDRAVLRSAGQQIACEGVAAAILYRSLAARAEALGARAGRGLEQPGLLAAEAELALALGDEIAAGRPATGIREVVDVYVARVPEARDAVRRIVLEVTRGAVAERTMAAAWREAHADGSDAAAREALARRRQALDAEVRAGTRSLWAATGAVIPVKVAGAGQRVGDREVPLVFDLNAMGDGEIDAIPGLTADERALIRAEGGARMYPSFDAFTRRCGANAAAKLERVRR